MKRRQFLKTAGGLFVPAILCRGQGLFSRRVAPVAVQSAAAYEYSATQFDGSAFLYQSSPIASDSQLGLFSAWIKHDGTAGLKKVISIGRVELGTINPEWGAIGLNTSAETVIFSYVATPAPDTNWHHLMWSYDLSTAGRVKMYLDGEDKTTSLTFTVGETVEYDTGANAREVHVGCGASDSGEAFPHIGALSEVYFTVPGSYFDLTNSTNLGYFRNATTGKPAGNLATNGAPSPLLYLRNGYATFGTNSGSGGDLTVSGTLTDAATKP